MIKPPADTQVYLHNGLYLGKSEKGVYCALVDHLDGSCRLRVWILSESCHQVEWVLSHQVDLKSVLARLKYDDQQSDGPWIFQDINYYGNDEEFRNDDGEIEPAEFEWDSDNDNVLQPAEFEWDSDNDNVVHDGAYPIDEYIDFLGFHPYKEVVFLSESLSRGLAYHLNSSKAQDLGYLYPTNYEETALANHQLIIDSFPYTPCLLDMYGGVP